jgi:hypothetical protein
MLINWTDEEREAATRGDVNIFILNTTPQVIKEMDKELPTDTHIIEYVIDGETSYDAVRGYKMSDIFNVYHDKFRRDSITAQVISIKSGYGCIKPKLYGYQAVESSKKTK